MNLDKIVAFNKRRKIIDREIIAILFENSTLRKELSKANAKILTLISEKEDSHRE